MDDFLFSEQINKVHFDREQFEIVLSDLINQWPALSIEERCSTLTNIGKITLPIAAINLPRDQLLAFINLGRKDTDDRVRQTILNMFDDNGWTLLALLDTNQIHEIITTSMTETNLQIRSATLVLCSHPLVLEALSDTELMDIIRTGLQHDELRHQALNLIQEEDVAQKLSKNQLLEIFKSAFASNDAKLYRSALRALRSSYILEKLSNEDVFSILQKGRQSVDPKVCECAAETALYCQSKLTEDQLREIRRPGHSSVEVLARMAYRI